MTSGFSFPVSSLSGLSGFRPQVSSFTFPVSSLSGVSGFRFHPSSFQPISAFYSLLFVFSMDY